VLCFSHLRWNFVFQRPNHLMTRCAREGTVLFIEEPFFDSRQGDQPQLEQIASNLWRLVPHLPNDRSEEEDAEAVRVMIRAACDELGLLRPIHWFYTPMLLPLADGLPSCLTVYDCMDELSNFAFAPPELIERERKLMAKAQLMFTGGMALYEAKRALHPNVHGIPSSVDTAFFARARNAQPEPTDQAALAGPIIGYCGVIDERLDLGLIEHIARERPDWQLVMIGPVVKIDEESLPSLPNIHYLGGKPYDQLPSYLAGWDVAIMPFALNEATRFISPTKTPEYLAAGLPVVSTAIRDVVEPYERLELVRIGQDEATFLAHLDDFVSGDTLNEAKRDEFLSSVSWDATWQRMAQLIRDTLAREAGQQTAHKIGLATEQEQHV